MPSVFRVVRSGPVLSRESRHPEETRGGAEETGNMLFLLNMSDLCYCALYVHSASTTTSHFYLSLDNLPKRIKSIILKEELRKILTLTMLLFYLH